MIRVYDDGVPLPGRNFEIIRSVRNRVHTVRFDDGKSVTLEGKAEKAIGRGIDEPEAVSLALLDIDDRPGNQWPTNVSPNPVDRSAVWNLVGCSRVLRGEVVGLKERGVAVIPVS